MIRFEWDPLKARVNERKHGVSFDDPSALFEQDRTDDSGEARWQVVGRAAGMAILPVAHVVRYEGRVVRLISARRNGEGTETR